VAGGCAVRLKEAKIMGTTKFFIANTENIILESFDQRVLRGCTVDVWTRD
jgi:hypothetical protein